jgi:hypothetical protein
MVNRSCRGRHLNDRHLQGFQEVMIGLAHFLEYVQGRQPGQLLDSPKQILDCQRRTVGRKWFGDMPQGSVLGSSAQSIKEGAWAPGADVQAVVPQIKVQGAASRKPAGVAGDLESRCAQGRLFPTIESQQAGDLASALSRPQNVSMAA